ncbi:hypothetical protein [Dactylosporangium sp. NPDC000521]|uniref:hypothetical protein n=1 Tax=Dactylosporangium sp. NPDC000521 TaxID=3363975 RepID=UPI0036B47246
MSTQPPDPTSSAAPHPAYAAGPATSSFAPQVPARQPGQSAPVTVDAKKARSLTLPYRELAAFVLLGATAAYLLAGFISLLTSLDNNVLLNAGGTFGRFVNLQTILLPVLAVLVATHIDPVVPKAKVIVLVGLVEYGVAALFGLILLLASLIGDLDTESGLRATSALTIFLTRLADLALLGLVFFLVIRVYLGAYAPPKPAPGVYGQPAYPYGQQPGYQHPQQQYGYQQQTGSVPQQPYQQQPAQHQQPTGGWSNPATTGTGQVVPGAQQYAAQPLAHPAAQASGAPAVGPASGAPAYNQQAAPGYNPQSTGAPAFNAQAAPAQSPQSTGAPAFTAPAFAPQPAAAEPVSAAPASTPPLSSPFATYTAPSTQPVSAPPVTPPVSSPPADGGATPSGGFAAAGWPGGSSTHPTSGAATGAPAAQQPAEDTGAGAASPFGKTGAFPEAGTAAGPAGEPTAAPAGQEPTAQIWAAGETTAAHGIGGEPETQAAPVSIAKADADPDATAASSPVSAAAAETTGDVTGAHAPAHPGAEDVTQAHSPAHDPDATEVFRPAGQEDPRPSTDHGDDDETQRTQAIPPKH